MRVRYIGESFGASGLTDGTVYDCLEIDRTDEQGLEFGIMLRIVDDSGEDYLYPLKNPRPLNGSSPGGSWEIVEDDEKISLAELLKS